MKNMNVCDGETSAINDPLAEKVIGCAVQIHKVLGPGFLEASYHQALAHELSKAQIEYVSEACLQVMYDGLVLGGYVADFLVDKRVVVELKAVEVLIKSHEIQLVNYLTAIRFDVGLLINFGGPKIQVRRKFREFHRMNSDPI
jgi:GxxExxY protein